MAMNPLEVLHRMELAYQQSGAVLPQEAVVAEQWVGLAFRVGNLQLITAMDNITEVVPCVPFAQVPRTRSWMRGLANVRGTLLSVIDLQAFLGMDPVSIDQYSRLMVINNEGLAGCLLVSRLQGLRHFDPVEDRCGAGEVKSLLGDNELLSGYVTGGLFRDQSRWLVFETERLIADERFRQVAA